MKIGCILLAAGAGARFGGDKLSRPLRGRPVIEYILAALPQDCFSKCVIVAGNSNLLQSAEKHGISGILNINPGLGISKSIQMGLTLLPDAEACLFCVCDQPLLTGKTIRSMVQHYRQGIILALASHGTQGNPVLFPAALFNELSSLKGEESGKTVIRAHPSMLALFETEDAAQLLDIDTRKAFDEVETHMCL